MMSLADALKGYIRGSDPNIDMLIDRYDEIVKEEKIVKKRGYQKHDYCWKCKKFKDKLRYRICPNGSLTYWCSSCAQL
jgi:hypothetical protein